MILKRHYAAAYFQFEEWLQLEGFCHGFFTRRGGCSPKPFDSLNVSFGVADQNACVAQNRRTVAAAFGKRDVVALQQEHGADVFVLNREKLEAGGGRPPRKIRADAVITDIRGHLLMIQTADCQPVMLYDPVCRAAGNVHAGWRGSAADIIGKTVEQMTIRFGASPKDILAGIGPSLGPCCAEFRNYPRELPPAFWRHRIGLHHFDFWAISRSQLMAAGIRPQNIYVSRYCTRCRPEWFFSFRRRRRTGRQASIIGLV